ncbi:MAG: diguanylate cyclase [Lachnospiraceae bacterium]|nr:diguanylate cyclase [Lachnospiraceae bacterium]MBP3578618.1 diguanylate cyclase [Lachnospiraceae bacterium]
MRLRDRLYITLLAITLVPLLLCGLIMLYQNNKNAEGLIEENLLGISKSQIDNIENFFEKVKQDMEIVANYSFLQQEVLVSLGQAESNDASARKHLEEILQEHMLHQPYIQSMVITDKNFCTVAASEEYEVGVDSGLGIASAKLLTGDFAIGNIYNRQASREKIQAVLAYIGIYYHGELIGYLAEEIRIDYFDRYHEGNIFWDNGVMIIRDGNGSVVTIGGAGENADDFIQQQEKHDQKIENERIKRGYHKEGAVNYSVDDEKYIAAYSTLKYTDWTIRVSANIDSYMTVGISYGVLFVAILVVSFLLMQVMNKYVTIKTVQPMEEIRDVLQKVQQTNDYSIRLEPGTDDEMGQLQHEVNRLLQCVMELQMREKEEQKSLEKKAEKDPMTGVMNKKAIAARVQQMAEEIEPRDGKIAVGFVDIDDFRDYNTNYGHAEGDHVIKFVAHTLREMIPGSVGRNGGDEFVFCMETDGREIVAQTMELLARKLQNGVINGVTGERMPIPCSIGIVIERAGKTDYRKLIQEADEAMYQAKGNGKNTYYILVK